MKITDKMANNLDEVMRDAIVNYVDTMACPDSMRRDFEGIMAMQIIKNLAAREGLRVIPM